MARARLSVYDVYCDPGHGWLKTTKEELVRLGIADKITRYSYMRGEHVYLEEDCDVDTFFKAKEARGEKIVMRSHHSNKSSRIRNYYRYSATA